MKKVIQDNIFILYFVSLFANKWNAIFFKIFSAYLYVNPNYLTYLYVIKNKTLMVLAKTELFDQQEQHCAELFKALGHPARIQILKYLADIKACVSGDISKELPLGRTTVNQHLKELKRVGLIQGIVSGSRTNYCLNPEKVSELKSLAEGFLSHIDIDPEEINC